MEKMGKGLNKEAEEIIKGTDPLILARAISYLYTRETKSSFAIEGEKAGETRGAVRQFAGACRGVRHE